MQTSSDELVFVPLGGIGEIGMNAGLYGFGGKKNRRWILVDCGIAFAGPELPGIEVMVPDLQFIKQQKKRLEAIIITHAHEDHIGALMDLWPSLEAPVYASRFAASLLEIRRFREPGAQHLPLHIIEPGQDYVFGPFTIEPVKMAHSIPESMGLIIKTALGTLFHSGDWKIDTTPYVGWATDEERLRRLGDEGVLALICDSTNVTRDGISPSETEVALTLKEMIAKAKGRVCVTTFASNVARIRNGQMLRLAPGDPEVLDHVHAGRLYRDGQILLEAEDRAVSERRKLSFAGMVSVAVAINAQGDVVGDVSLALAGLPQADSSGQSFDDIVEEAVFSVLDTLPKAKRRDPDLVETAIERAIRSSVNQSWGKKPLCHIQVVIV